MFNEETNIFLTFLLAILGYAGLTVTMMISLKKKIPFLFWRITAAVILIHVFMVWNYHYEWQFRMSVRNGYFGFIIFHSALLLILISTFLKGKASRILIIISFMTVSAGAIGASFRYEIVSIYRVPVLLFASAGFIFFLWNSFIKSLNFRQNFLKFLFKR